MKKTRQYISLTLLLLLFTSPAYAQHYQLKRVEPMFWWIEMHDPNLQVLLYGKDIGELNPKIDYPGVTINKTVRVENDNYLFVYLHIDHQTKPGTFEVSLTRNGDEMVDYRYELKARAPSSAQREGFNSSDVIYLITPDRFANGNYENDSVQGYADKLNRQDAYGRHGGDIQGIINHLNYIEEMGFTVVWLNPVLENQMPDGSYHGYAITDYYKVDPRFGSNELYKKLSNELEERGMKLIMDMVTNHTGSNHWWMQDPPTDDWYHYQDDFTKTNHQRVTLHDPYAAQIDKKHFTHGWFVKTMPDLNQSNQLLVDYLVTNAIWWIEYAGLDGIRHDTHSYSGQPFLKQWTCRILAEYPNFTIVGEEWSLNPITIAKWQRGSKLPKDFKSCLPSLMDFPLHSAIIKALTQKEGWGTGFINLYKTLSYDYLYPHPNDLVVFLDNHDMDRFYRQVHKDFDLFKMGMAWLLTTRGIPQIYYGTEILMTNKKSGSHGQIRSDFPGGWKSDTMNAFTGQGLSQRQKEAQAYAKELLNWRKNNPVIYSGKLMHYLPKNGVYVYFRYNKKETVMVALNKNEKEILLNGDRFHERLADFTKGVDVITEETYQFDHLVVPDRSALILELKK